ncbi:hypothetical protein [Variovorax rhizosphaerae]|uniref:Uncharacterized protein n=1 Tax=Variovorax rhizosphaerae TaxID=1836200 RepID=A0ABU8WSW9_9BURK
MKDDTSAVPASDEDWPKLPDNWRCSIEIDATGDGQYGGTLELKCDGVLKCRMAITHIGRTKSEAYRRAKERAERWMADWTSRHTGEDETARRA